MGSQILLYGAHPCDAGRPRDLLQSSGGRIDRILLASVLSSLRAMCPVEWEWKKSKIGAYLVIEGMGMVHVGIPW